MARLFFATDIHGSEVCWRKFLNAGAFYGAGVLVLGGDMTGKALVPLVQEGGRVEAELAGHRYLLETEDAVREMEGRIAARGFYSVRVNRSEVADLQADPGKVDALFWECMRATLERWLVLAEEKLRGRGIRCYLCPGNDDRFEVDEIIRQSVVVELAEGRVADVDGVEMISTGWSNPTPWQTHRECSEEEMGARIEQMTGLLRDPGRAIFNLHCPPYGSKLDEAPALDEALRPLYGGQAVRPVGSTAVRDAILRHQPVLSLHGHIHESKGVARLGRTLALNPGSSYEAGVLHGALVEIDAQRGVRSYMLVTG
ncbi:MAG: metallophosphoesterase [Armatimonadetes bacterium]|nr:metallophosphoesterase [Armatimonadota bacterium]